MSANEPVEPFQPQKQAASPELQGEAEAGAGGERGGAGAGGGEGGGGGPTGGRGAGGGDGGRGGGCRGRKQCACLSDFQTGCPCLQHDRSQCANKLITDRPARPHSTQHAVHAASTSPGPSAAPPGWPQGAGSRNWGAGRGTHVGAGAGADPGPGVLLVLEQLQDCVVNIIQVSSPHLATRREVGVGRKGGGCGGGDVRQIPGRKRAWRQDAALAGTAPMRQVPAFQRRARQQRQPGLRPRQPPAFSPSGPPGRAAVRPGSSCKWSGADQRRSRWYR